MNNTWYIGLVLPQHKVTQSYSWLRVTLSNLWQQFERVGPLQGRMRECHRLPILLDTHMMATRLRAGPAGPKHKMPMVLLASQELAARAATRDQHLLPGAQTFVPENTSNIWVLTWQRPLKTIRGCILYC